MQDYWTCDAGGPARPLTPDAASRRADWIPGFALPLLLLLAALTLSRPATPEATVPAAACVAGR